MAEALHRHRWTALDPDYSVVIYVAKKSFVPISAIR
jgi:hypothetical protein